MLPRRGRVFPFAFLLFSVAAVPARATDHPLSGRRVTVRLTKTGPRLSLRSTDGSAAFPTAGSPDDLATTGVTIDVVTAAGVAASATIPAATGGWTKTTKSYRFGNPAAPAGVSTVRAFKLRKDKGVTLDLRPVGLPLTAPLGSVAVRIAYASERVCMLFAGASVRKDTAGRFLAVGASGAGIASCNASDLGGPAGCGNGDVEAGEQCDGAPNAACFGPFLIGACGTPGTPSACQCCAPTGQLCGLNGSVGVPCCDPAAVCQFQNEHMIPGYCTPPFLGCNATGTWEGYPNDPYGPHVNFIVEGAGGVLSLVGALPDLLTYQVLDGSRVGPNVYAENPPVQVGTQTSCTSMHLFLQDLHRVSTSTCGDDVLDDASAYGIAEECDDGNHTAGDCCSPTCRIEPGCP